MKHTVYTIEVSCSDGWQWRIQRRYKEFRMLHRLFVKGASPMPFPPMQSPCGNLDPAFIEIRRCDLQRYLARLLDTQSAGLSSSIQSFLAFHRRTEGKRVGAYETTRRRALSEERSGGRARSEERLMCLADKMEPDENSQSQASLVVCMEWNNSDLPRDSWAKPRPF